MAKRNRKNGQEDQRATVWGIASIGVVAILAVVYLGLLNTCESIGRQIKDLEGERARLHKQVVNEEHNWAMARSIRNLQRLMEVHGIAMSFPEQKNVIHMCPKIPEAAPQYAFRAGSPARD